MLSFTTQTRRSLRVISCTLQPSEQLFIWLPRQKRKTSRSMNRLSEDSHCTDMKTLNIKRWVLTSASKWTSIGHYLHICTPNKDDCSGPDAQEPQGSCAHNSWWLVWQRTDFNAHNFFQGKKSNCKKRLRHSLEVRPRPSERAPAFIQMKTCSKEAVKLQILHLWCFPTWYEERNILRERTLL